MSRASHNHRRGAATVELAVCLPPILLMLFGSIECSGMIFLQQSLAVSSYEGTRAAIRFDATNARVMDDINQILTARKVNDATVTLSPPDVRNIARGTRVTVRVSAPCQSNAFLPYLFSSGRRLSAACTMVKE